MAKSMYAETPVIDNFFATTSLPVFAKGLRELDLFAGVRTIEHILQRGERLDHLAARYLGDDDYWWVIALGNKIDYPLGISAGTSLKIPMDVNDVLGKIFKR